jgi:long-chain acyl-CoA synthetase
MKLLFVENSGLYRKLAPVLKEVRGLANIAVFVGEAPGNCLSWEQIVALGKSNPQPGKLDEAKRAVRESDLATIIYTSGTTGVPKGVMLTHANIIANFKGVADIPSAKATRALSFLPACHAYERMLLYLYHYLGISIYYAESIGTIAQNIKEINPTMMTCVPRLLEKIYDKLYASGKNLPFLQRKLYYWAFDLACEYRPDARGTALAVKRKLADKLIYSKWRKAIGGDFDIIVSGGSAIQPRVWAFFSAIGMPVYEGYGLSETSPVIAVSRRNRRKPGSVGLALPGVEIRIGEHDEIQCRGHNVMAGYYKDPRLTAEAIDAEGWFHTGDTGRFDADGFLYITGRLKSIFKTSFGKYVNPAVIESKFSESPFIDQILVVGENRQFAAALIVPDLAYLKIWCRTNGIDCTTDAEMIEDPKVNARIREELARFNKGFGDYEQVRRYRLIADEWSVANEMLSPTLKVRRKAVVERYAEAIEKLFA